MTARCISCNRYHNFKATRGARLADQRCRCSGKLELITSADPITVSQDLALPEGVSFEDIGDQRRVIYPQKNRAGQLFLYIPSERKYSPLNLAHP